MIGHLAFMAAMQYDDPMNMSAALYYMIAVDTD